MSRKRHRTSEIASTTSRPMSTSEVEEEYGIPVGTLRYWRHCNIGPRSYSVGRSVRYDRADVEEWLGAQKQASARGGVA